MALKHGVYELPRHLYETLLGKTSLEAGQSAEPEDDPGRKMS